MSACKRCGRPVAADSAELDSDDDGQLCGKTLPERGEQKFELYADCCAHEAHVLRLRLMRAESLLGSSAMCDVMGADYQRKHSLEVRAFLSEPSLTRAVGEPATSAAVPDSSTGGEP